MRKHSVGRVAPRVSSCWGNLRKGVLVPDIYDPILNPPYRDVLAHYGAVALLFRIKDPDRKQKWNLASATPHERSKESALRAWRKHKPI